MLLEGLQLPLTTPFYPDGRLNLRKLEHNVARYSKTPVAGLAVLSDVGEPTMLSDEESRHVMEIAAGAAAREKVLLAGVSRDSVVATLDLSEHAARFQYDAVLVKPPSFLRDSRSTDQERQLLVYFQALADRCALPILLDEGSSRSTALSEAVVIELAAHSNILGLVTTMGGIHVARLQAATAPVKRNVVVTPVFAAVTVRMQALQQAALTGELISADTLKGGATTVTVAPSNTPIKTRTKIVGFQILAGSIATTLESLQAGAVGAMPPFAAASPQACYEVLAAWKDGDEGLALEKQVRLNDVARKIEEKLGVAGIKFGCDLNGYFGGRPRLPLLPPGGEERAEIESLMQGLRN